MTARYSLEAIELHCCSDVSKINIQHITQLPIRCLIDLSLPLCLLTAAPKQPGKHESESAFPEMGRGGAAGEESSVPSSSGAENKPNVGVCL